MKLSRLDGVLSWAVKILYILALGTSFYAFFSGTAVAEPWLNIVFSFALSIALILHELLSQLRFGTACAALFRVKRSDSRFGSIAFQAASNGAMMLVLLAFDVYNSLEYQGQVKAYPHLLSAVAQITIQGTAVPMLFFLSTFLLQFHPDAASVLSQHSIDMLYRTLKVAKRQWKLRMDKAEKDGTNFTPILVTLMNDNGDSESAQRIQTIEAGLVQTEQNRGVGKSSKLYLSPAQAQSGAKASQFPTTKTEELSAAEDGNVRRFRKPRAKVKRTPQERIWNLMDRDDSLQVPDLVKQTKLDRKTVKKHYDSWCEAHTLHLAEG